MKKLLKVGALGGAIFFTSGCALPVPIQVASWALDGVSYIVTEKSVTDHGLSAVAQKDCAVWRGVTDGELCREWGEKGDTLLASVSGFVDMSVPYGAINRAEIPTHSDLSPSKHNVTEVRSIMNKQNELDPVDPLDGVSIILTKLENTESKLMSSRDGNQRHPSVRPLAGDPDGRDEPVEGIYFVIGSFRNYGNAKTLAASHGRLLPTVLTPKLNSAPVYRVVVGPAEPGHEKALHSKIAGIGLSDTWAIRVQSGDWALAEGYIKQVKRSEMNSELAKLPQ